MGTGPSLRTIDPDRARAFQAQGGSIFAVNYYSETDMARHVRPDFYVLADPVFLTDWRDIERARNVWDYLAEPPSPVIFVPAHLDASLLPGGLQFAFFNGLGLDGWTRNTSPLKARGFAGITAYHAISLALFMGFQKVFTIGIDNDAFKTVAVTERGESVLKGHHAYVDQRDYLLPGTSNQIPATLEEYGRLIANMEMFDCSRLVNLAPESLMTAYPLGSLDDWLRES
jgi:hypothetical protein